MNNIRTLYQRLGGYDAVYAFIEYVIAKLMAREEVGQIWKHMSEDRVKAELQSFVDFASSHWGGPAVYQGRDMVSAHKGMGITESHWQELLEPVPKFVGAPHAALREPLRCSFTRL